MTGSTTSLALVVSLTLLLAGCPGKKPTAGTEGDTPAGAEETGQVKGGADQPNQGSGQTPPVAGLPPLPQPPAQPGTEPQAPAPQLPPWTPGAPLLATDDGAYGWLDANGQATRFALALEKGTKPSGVTATFKCRYAKGTSVPSAAPWTDCVADGTARFLEITRDVSAADDAVNGTYTLEARAEAEGRAGAVTARQVYLHTGLDHEPVCPVFNASDDVLVAAAAAQPRMAAPIALGFGTGTAMSAPRSRIEWAQFTPTAGLTAAPGMLIPLATDTRSLHRVFRVVASADGQPFLVMKRKHGNRTKGATQCTTELRTGSDHGSGRGHASCDAIVANVYGRALCLHVTIDPTSGATTVAPSTEADALRYAASVFGQILSRYAVPGEPAVGQPGVTLLPP